MVRIKVCGITRPVDAALAARLGAWAIGLVFAKSPRQVTVEQAKKICRQIDAHVLKVGVFVNATVDEIVRIASSVGLDFTQLHGQEDTGFCRTLKKHRIKPIKAIRMKGPESLEAVKQYDKDCPFLLLDTFRPGQAGGTGRTFNWDLAKKAISMTQTPILLAGGITSENIQKATQDVSPYAIDISSGSEESPGIKSAQLLKTLFNNTND